MQRDKGLENHHYSSLKLHIYMHIMHLRHCARLWTPAK